MTTRRPTRRKKSRLEEAEAWWSFLARVAAFIFGAFLIYREQGPPPGVEWAIVVVGAGCMGPTVASAVATILEAMRGGAQEGT